MSKENPLKKSGSGKKNSNSGKVNKTNNNNSKSKAPDSIPQKILKDIKKSIKFDKKTIKMNIPFILFAWAGNKISYAWHISGGDVATFIKNINSVLTNPMPSFAGMDILIGIGTVVAFKLIMYFKKKNKKNFRDKEEYGSARWGTEKDIDPYVNHDDFYGNIVLTATESLTMESRPQSGIKYARNKNIIVVGGSGSGKTRFFIKPNIMQMHSSYVVTDPKGTVLLEVGKMLEENGYEIKVLNTINFDKSMHYNPFAYINNEEDILKLVNTIISNTKGDGDKGGEDFWVKAERLLYTAYIGLIYYEFPKEEQNFSTLIDLINSSETREDDETFENAVDRMFNAIEDGVKVIEGYEIQKDKDGNAVKDEDGKEIKIPIYKKDENGEYIYEYEPNPDHFAVRQYKKYKLAAGKTAKSILISCGARLAPFDIEALRNIMAYDEMQLDTLGERNTALFVIVSDTTDTYNFVVAMMYSQLFNLLCTIADDKHGGRLPVHVRCLLDEFANIGQIPNFDKLIATIRSREISASIVLQSQSQLKAIYKDNADTIIGNCDTMLFLGGKEKSTLKELSEILGKQTIDLYNTSENRGQSQSYGLNYNKTGRELMSQDEIAVMDGEKCILQIRGVRPFLSKKFDITNHNHYKKLSDYNKNNEFNIADYLERRLKVSKKTIIHQTIEYDKEKVEQLTAKSEQSEEQTASSDENSD